MSGAVHKDISLGTKDELFKNFIYKQENELRWVILPEFDKNVFKEQNKKMTYDINELIDKIKTKESEELDRIVNTILADIETFTFNYDNEDNCENFSKGYIVDDYEYNEKMRPTGGSIVYYSQELYTESLDSQINIMKKFSDKLQFELNKSTVAKSFAYKLANLVLDQYLFYSK